MKYTATTADYSTDFPENEASASPDSYETKASLPIIKTQQKYNNK